MIPVRYVKCYIWTSYKINMWNLALAFTLYKHILYSDALALHVLNKNSASVLQMEIGTLHNTAKC